MKSITITAAMNRLVTCLVWGMSFTINANSRITETLRDSTVNPYPPSDLNMGMYLQPDFDSASETRDLKLGLTMFGNGGHAYLTNGSGAIVPTTYPHKATHTGMFSPLPLIARTLANDLTGSDKALYRLRYTGQINGVMWVFYFGRISDTSQGDIIELLETVSNGVVTSSIPYVPTVNDLRPTHDDLSVDSNGTFMRTYSSTSVSFTEDQISELQNACTVLYGNSDNAVISEIAFCFGKDKPVTRVYDTSPVPVLSNTAPDTFEFIACHMGIVESTFKPVAFTGAINDIKNVGISEPLYGAR